MNNIASIFVKAGEQVKDDNRLNNYRAVGVFLSVGMTMAASVALGYIAVNWLDGRFGTTPWLTLILFLLGTAAGLKSLYNLAFSENNSGKDKG